MSLISSIQGFSSSLFKGPNIQQNLAEGLPAELKQQFNQLGSLSELKEALPPEIARMLNPPSALDPAQLGERPVVSPGATRGSSAPSFPELLGNLVESVDAKGKTSTSEARKLMLGQSDNLHQSMIAMQEAGVAFSLLVEVRNKLVESYQELMRMQV